MSSRVDLAEFLSAYLAEADEQLSIANTRVLAIEASQRKAELNPRAVRDLFRALHTVKGLSAMVGVEPVVGIAHRMETVLRAADRAGGALPPGALEPLVEGLRAIGLRVRALADGQPVPPPPTALLAALEALESGDDPRAPGGAATLELEPAIAGKLAPFEKEQLLRAASEGARAVRLEFIPSAERAAAGLSINSVRERLGALGELVKVVPLALSPSEGAPSGLAFVLLLVTTATDDALAAAAGVDASAVRPIGRRLPPEAASIVTGPSIDDAGDEGETLDRKNVLRVDVARVDDALEKLGGLIVSRSRLTRAIATLTAAGADTRELRQLGGDLTRQLRDLRAAILQVRMVRVSDTLDRVPLVVRGLRRVTGKQVRLDVDAGDAELDKAVSERIFPAILHLVRNAVDHGIEAPEVRRAAGKPEEGVVRISAHARSNTQLEIVVSDDGGGIDPARVATRARAPVPTSDAALLDLLCQPGLSTRDEVTTVSGRGLGMDIVKRAVVDELGGELTLTTVLGAGTSFTLRVPLTVAIVDAFTTQCGTERFVVPVASVDEIVEIAPSDVVAAPLASPGGATPLTLFVRRGEAVPLVDLAALFGVRRVGPATKAIVVRRSGQPVGFLIDRVLGQEEAVVRPLTDPLVDVPGVSGATDLGDGRPTLVIDLVALAAPRATPLLGGPSSPPLLALPWAPREIPRA